MSSWGVTQIAGPCCPGKARVRSLVVDGHEVGFVDLDEVIEAVRSACPIAIDEARAPVLARLRESDYVPGSAEEHYVGAVLAEFLRCHPQCASQIEGMETKR